MLNKTLLHHDRTYIVGVSGGCDSMALLYCLRKEGFHCIVAHVNYNLRNDTEIDYQVVHDYCQKYGIKFAYKEVEHHEGKGNFQSQAREVRYLFYKDLLRQYKADAVVLGHHHDDVLENIYMSLNRGSQSHFIGIKEVSQVMGMKIIRPFLSCHKKDLRRYCEEEGIVFHDDYTNFGVDFERDRVRNTILNTYSEEEKEALYQRAQDINCKQKEKEEAIQGYLDLYHKQGKIDFHLVEDHLMDTFLYALLEECIPSTMIGRSLIEEIKKQIKSEKPNIQMNLPIHFLFIKEYNNITIQLHSAVEEYSYQINQGETFECEYFSIKSEGSLNSGIPVKEEDFPLTIRNMKPGDRIVTAGGTKKVSRLFIDAKIPKNQRRIWPVVLNCKGEVLLVPEIAKRKGYLSINPYFFVIK